jgi:hypothetical protein
MLKRLLSLALVVGLGLAGQGLTQRSEGAGQDDDQRIAELVKKLGSMNYAEREKATKDLETIGMAALDKLRQAAKQGDLETKTRCEKLVDKLETKLAADKLLAPTKVRLKVKDTTVVQAIEELQKQSGYQILIDGDRAPLTKRTITLDTGEVTFWEAFDQLSAKCNLTLVPTAVYLNGLPTQRQLPRPPPLPLNVVPVPPQAVPVKPGQPGADAPADAKPAQGGKEQEIQLQMQVELPAAGGNAKMIVPIQVGVGAAASGQVQMQGQFQPAQPVPGKGGTVTRQIYYPPGTIVVRDGAFDKVPTSYSGALRIRLLPASKASEIGVQPRQAGEALFVLEVSAEPKLQMFSVTGHPSLQRAVDDLSQDLTLAMEPTPNLDSNPNPNRLTGTMVYNVNRSLPQVALRLKLGAKQAQELAELKGTITIEALTAVPEALITVSNLEKSIGKKVESPRGGSIEIRSFTKEEGGRYKVQVTFQAPQPFYPYNRSAAWEPDAVLELRARAAIMQPAPAKGQAVPRPSQNISGQAYAFPQLVDAHGKVLTLEQMPQRSARSQNGVVVQEVTMIYRAGEGVGEPTQAILFGHRKVTAEASFAFKDVPLQ